MWCIIKQTPKFTLLFVIRFYQKTISLDHGFFKFLRPFGQCKFYPTCSDYAIMAIKRYGALNGGWKAIKRIFKCHPLAKGGYDPVQ
ncbi:membrane protein insertion efficiency factor YidD [Candidatus Kuenenbacteria bacterium CG11_big_fil_rev_8_21_14_0_20_37_9]|uniref:Putative membrane protein insertion efficiency factor n=1 Tax=Candidatus Kuenenbacteria bacterium CG08_land_8_20_14_0_20_37_23 TaxID=1974617 RepID=A0A2M6XTR7_9BACT|nr:MAG: membrane protein insertion efficiency factor YidD [Candidatus Kuenenbacteria bacterium CG11_big_fil_rev_8_21_14_0_20_37_9]PIU10971.1 MAG: membrane protein insertion efficiency factor YidD [Candidatus Kuenenbacteria bacterium CG08_land_8_20_14_0_20_37_23]